MSQWYVKELAKLAGVTVQTLHYYDKNDVLKPSVRLSNGYRMYSQADLIKLQQIVALRFFGFGLTEIKKLLSENVDAQQQLSQQIESLEQRAQVMIDAANKLKNIAQNCDFNKSTSWESVIQMIAVYHLVQRFEKTWLGTIFNNEQLKRLVTQFSNIPEADKITYSKEWEKLVAQVSQQIHTDPCSAPAQIYAKKWINLVQKYFSEKDLGDAIWKAYLNGNIPTDEADRAGYPYISQEVALWIDKAVYFMYSNKKKK